MPLVNSEDKNQPGTAIANTKTRVVGYDIAKVLAMFLVVLLHYSFYVGSIPDSRITRAAMTITVVCVPTFITVNGAILLNKPLNVKKHARKLLRVAMLLFIWRGIHIVAYRILGSPSIGVAQVVSILLGNTGVDGYLTGHFWFLEALIALYAILPIIKLAFDNEDKRPLAIAIGALALLTFGLDGIRSVAEAFFGSPGTKLSATLQPISNLNIFGPYGYLIVYFVVGGFLGSKRATDAVRKHSPTAFALVALAIVSVGITVALHEAQYSGKLVGPFSTKNGYWLPMTLLETIALVLLCLAMGNVINSSKIKRFATFMGSNTLGVYLLHMFVLTAAARTHVVDYFIPQSLSPATRLIISALFVLSIQVLLSIVSDLLRKTPAVKWLFSL